MDDKEIVNLYWQRNEDAIPVTAAKYGSYCRIIAFNVEFAEYPSDPGNMELLHNMVKFEFDEISYHAGSVGLDDDGVWRSSVTGGQGIVTDTLTIHFFDWDNNPVGDIVFVRK